MQSLTFLLGEETLRDKSFLDIGCGSGLFSIAAARLGVQTVIGIDSDPVSVRTSEENAKRWIPDSQAKFGLVSVLNNDEMSSLGQFDVVYSWGVLHHTGNMTRAISSAARCVKKGGIFMIAIYNRHWSSGFWKTIKWLYNRIGKFGQELLILGFTPIIFLAKWLVTFRNPLEMGRGMDFMHNIIDWVGGYPYEYASIDEIKVVLDDLHFQVIKILPAKVPTGCNEFVCKLR